jgi:predicted ArsR family transcriptional regulator
MAKTLGSIVPLKLLKVRRKVASKEARKPLLRPVLELLAERSMTDRQVADQLGISTTAARGQLRATCNKDFAVAQPPNARHPTFTITTSGRAELRRHLAFVTPEQPGAAAPQIV